MNKSINDFIVELEEKCLDYVRSSIAEFVRQAVMERIIKLCDLNIKE